MKIKFRYKKNPHQKEFHSDVLSKYLHLSSGFGGGKTFAIVMKMFQLSWLNRNIAGGLVCPSFADYKRDVLPTIEGILDEHRIKYEHHKTEHWFRFPWSKGKVWVTSAEKSLRGPNWGWAVINEVTLIDQVRYREVIGRVRIKNTPHPQVASSGTPEGIGHWLHEMFIEEETKLDRSRIIYGDTRDNQDNLAPDYIQSLEESYDSIMLDAYLRGLFVTMTGDRFYYYYDPNRNDDRTIKENKSLQVHIGIDFNVDPMTATVWHYDGQTIRAFDEIILHNADTQKLADAMLSRGYTPDRSVLYPDPSGNARSTKGQPDIQILKNNGYQNIRVRSSHPSFRQRQLSVNNLLEKRVITLHPDKCPTLKKDLIAVELDKVTLGKVKENKKLTHASDGLDYMCDILFPYSGKRESARVVTYR